MTDKYIEVHDLTAGYKGTAVLENISFDICRGEMISIVGPNGAGKSTLLYALSGLLAPMSGKILIEGQDLNRISDGDRARKIAVMFTERVKKEAGISEMKADIDANAPVYTLGGQRVSQPVKGIYVKSNRKVVVMK